MNFLRITKDGGAESTVWAYWLIELKWLGSIALLRFEDGSRDAYHSHAFDCVSWLISGSLHEQRIDLVRGFDGSGNFWFRPSWRPIITRRHYLHKVVSFGRSWVLTFRGPWSKTWIERLPSGAQHKLTHGRRQLEASDA